MVNMSAVWDRTIEFVSDNLASLLPIMLGAMFLPLAINDILSPMSATAGPGARMMLALFSLVLMLVVMCGRLAIVALALNTDLSVGDALRRGLGALFPVILVSLLIMVVFMVLLAPVLIILALYGYDFASAMQGSAGAPQPVAVAWSVLYVIVVLPLVAWIGARLALLNPVIVAERLGISAIGRSISLTRGLAWKIIGVAILYGVIALVLELAVKAALGTVIRLLIGGDPVFSVGSVLISMIVAAVGTVLAVFASAFLSKLYIAACARETTESAE